MNEIEQAIQEEHEYVRKNLDVEKLIAFQDAHSVEIVRGADFMYLCYIDKNGWGTSFTPLAALIYGIEQYEQHRSK